MLPIFHIDSCCQRLQAMFICTCGREVALALAGKPYSVRETVLFQQMDTVEQGPDLAIMSPPMSTSKATLSDDIWCV